MNRLAALVAGVTAFMVAACAPVYLADGTPPARPSGEVERVATGERVDGPVGEPSTRWYPPPPEAGEGGEATLSGVLSALVWPLAADGATILTSDYGHRVHPVHGAWRFHTGLDLRAPGGTPVHAAADGVVVKSGKTGAYGWMVEIDHGAELRSLYAHHRRNLVREGEAVRRGQVIALVGATGNATGDHLHFELRWKDGTVDPASVLPPLSVASAR